MTRSTRASAVDAAIEIHDPGYIAGRASIWGRSSNQGRQTSRSRLRRQCGRRGSRRIAASRPWHRDRAAACRRSCRAWQRHTEAAAEVEERGRITCARKRLRCPLACSAMPTAAGDDEVRAADSQTGYGSTMGRSRGQRRRRVRRAIRSPSALQTGQGRGSRARPPSSRSSRNRPAVRGTPGRRIRNAGRSARSPLPDLHRGTLHAMHLAVRCEEPERGDLDWN